MHDSQTMAVLVVRALEFEYHLALELSNSDSSSALARVVVRTDVSA